MLANSIFLKILNRILKNNEGSLHLLKSHTGKSFCLNIIGVSVTGIIERDGFVEIAPENEYSVEIIVPLSAATYLINNDRLALIKQIRFTGDKQFGRELLEIISNLNLHIIAIDANPAITLLLMKIGDIARAILAQLKLNANNASNSITEYLLYENEELITHHEMDNFCNEVDELRMQVDRLTQHIALLKMRNT